MSDNQTSTPKIAATAGGQALAPPIWILIIATATGPLALNVFVPSMPGLTETFSTDYATIQLTLTLYLVGVAFAQLAYGPASDRFGRRPALLVGVTLFILGSALSAFAWSIEVLILARVLQAVGGCAGMVLGRAIVRDVYDRDSSASVIAVITMAMAVAPAIAPTIGGLIDGAFGWRITFAIPTALGMIVLLGALLRLNETNLNPVPSIDVVGMLQAFISLLKSRQFVGYAMNTACSVGAFFSFLAGAPYIMVEILNRAPHEYGFYFVLISLGYIFGNFVASRTSKRLGIDRMLLLGFAVSIVGAVAGIAAGLAGIVNPASVFAPMCVIAIGNGLGQPNGIAGAISVNPRIAGSASGLMGFLQMAMGAAFTIIVGIFQTETDQMAMATMILLATVASGLFYALARSTQTSGR